MLSYPAGGMKPRMRKFLVVDDHPMFRESLCTMLGDAYSSAEIWQAANLAEALKLGSEHPDLDLILLDLKLPGTDGWEGLTNCRRKFPLTPIVVVSMWEMGTSVKTVLSMGANGFIAKSTSKDQMQSGIERVLNGDVVQIAQESDEINLGPRKLEILKLVAQGMSNKEIAEATELSVYTVRDYLQDIMTELNVENRTKAAVAAQKLGLLLD